jgi:hypothetical protein
MEAVAGDRAMPVRVGLVTVMAADPETPLNVAVMFALPVATPVARPLPATVAVAVLLLDQVAVDVQFEVVLFE